MKYSVLHYMELFSYTRLQVKSICEHLNIDSKKITEFDDKRIVEFIKDLEINYINTFDLAIQTDYAVESIARHYKMGTLAGVKVYKIANKLYFHKSAVNILNSLNNRRCREVA